MAARTHFSSTFVNKIIAHYLRYDKDNPYIFISALLAFLGIATGVAVLMLAMGIMHGTQKEFEKRLFVMNYPLTILPLEEEAIDEKLIATIQKHYPELELSPYYTTQAISRAGGVVQGALVYGVDAAKEKAVNSIFAKALKDHSFKKYEVIVGKSLALEMGIDAGQKLILSFTQTQNLGFATMPLQKRFKVVGLFSSGLSVYDKAIIYITHEAFVRLLKRKPGIYDGIHIYTDDAFTMKEKLEALLDKNVVIEGWWQQNGNFFAAMEMEKRALFIVLLLIILVASLNIISSLLMTVMSRRSEIALMRTLGATQKEIGTIFFRLGLLIGTAGIITGVALGFLGMWVLRTFDIITLPADVYGTSKLPIDLTPIDFFPIIIGAMIIVLLAARYPAKKAATTDPLRVLRNE